MSLIGLRNEFMQASLGEWRNKYYLNGALGSDGNEGGVMGGGAKTLAAAYAKLETLKNDAIILEQSASSVSIATAAAGVWSKSMGALIGTGQSFMNQRSRLAQTTAFSPMIAISGYGNLFKNLYIQHGGVTSAANLVGLAITGPRNVFENVHVLSPMFSATQGAEATCTAVSIAAEENYFKHCVLGTDATTRAAGSLVRFEAGSTPRTVFEDCLFLMNATANAAFFLECAANLGTSLIMFKRCTFWNGGTALTYGIDGTGLNNCKMFFDAGCSFYGCTDVVAAAYESKVLFGITGSGVAGDAEFGLALPYDHTA